MSNAIAMQMQRKKHLSVEVPRGHCISQFARGQHLMWAATVAPKQQQPVH